MLPNRSQSRLLSVFQLVMINIIAIDSLRNLPTNAATGLHVVFYFVVAALFFLLPCVLLTADLATRLPITGGSYVWVREAFGARFGFFNVWLQWVYNVFWYPTILSFIAANIAYLIHPSLADNKLFMLISIVGLFTLATIINNRGIATSSMVSTISAIGGTLLPMFAIIGIGCYWLLTKHSLAILLNAQQWIPQHFHENDFSFLVIIFFSLMGIEMSATHAGDVKNPVRDYPRALLYSSLLILLTMILASLAIAIIVPQQELSIVSGLDQAFSLFLHALHASSLLPILILLIILGGFGGMSAWVIGPTRALMVATQDGCAPKIFGQENKKGAPSHLLLTQWIIVVLLSLGLLFFNSLSTWYWLLSDLTAQMALIFYITLFAAGIYMREERQNHNSTRNFLIIRNHRLAQCCYALGILACMAALVFGFFPPSTLHIKHVFLYEAFLFFGITLSCAIPFWIYRHTQLRKR